MFERTFLAAAGTVALLAAPALAAQQVDPNADPAAQAAPADPATPASADAPTAPATPASAAAPADKAETTATASDPLAPDAKAVSKGKKKAAAKKSH